RRARVPAREAARVRLERVGDRARARHAALEPVQEDRAVWSHTRNGELRCVMPERDWDKELAKIDKQLASISDDALLGPTPVQIPAKGKGGVPAKSGPAPKAEKKAA